MGINPHLTQGLDRFTAHDPANTVYLEAGVITFGLEYRFSYQNGSDGHLTDEVKDRGISIHIFEGPGSQGRELLKVRLLPDQAPLPLRQLVPGKTPAYLVRHCSVGGLFPVGH